MSGQVVCRDVRGVVWGCEGGNDGVTGGPQAVAMTELPMERAG
jgi:hypothetical protein